jgi:hypothetical protein
MILIIYPHLNPSALFSNKSIIIPVNIGAKKYPKRLNISWLKLEEVA